MARCLLLALLVGFAFPTEGRLQAVRHSQGQLDTRAMSPSGTLLPSVAGVMLRLAPMTALARCVCEIDGMAEGQVWAASILRSA